MALLTVSQLNFYIKSILDEDEKLRAVYLRAEISNYTDHYRTGHLYMSLKDEKSAVKAVMFAGNASRLKFRPEDGMKVLVRGYVSVYSVSGQYQFYIEDMQPEGIGALSLAFEQLKKKLAAEGLFAEEHKKPLPLFPKRIGVITSPTGAAVQDICRILGRRYPIGEIVICPVLVQGENAAAQLTAAVRKFNRLQCADVIIIGRGGGSAEDLWAFNDEALARAVYESEIPVVSG
ncbi:MAG: exodeoxyribonuclease VII large subunit, partial [Clostridia bacterium]|nr:exodeoxyribonuclease VII large subunit [Clostridia bacterium]